MTDRKEDDFGFVSCDRGEPDLGFIFRKKFGKDPSKLGLAQINHTVFGDQEPPTLEIHTDFVSNRGDVFATVDFGDPDRAVEELLKTW